jgi:hypothetical protein
MRVVLMPESGGAERPGASPRPAIAISLPFDYPDFIDLTQAGASLNARAYGIGRDGAFTVGPDRAPYRVTVEGLPFGISVKSMTYASADLAWNLR